MHPLCSGLACLLGLALAGTAAGGPLLPLKKTEPIPLPPAIPWAEVSERCRDLARAVVERPTLVARGPAETFPCQAEHYFYFLDHPDRAVHVWRRLGAKCVTISERGPGRFGWTDESGSDLVWETVHKDAGVRIWYAEGKVRPGPVLPLVPVRALVVLTHTTTKAESGAPAIQHRSELFVQTDSKTAAALTKMMGPSAQRVAEQGLAQLQLFFSALSWYLDRHPEQATAILKTDDR